jgi:PilZ domain
MTEISRVTDIDVRERRRAPRVPLRAPATIHIPRAAASGAGPDVVHGWLEDISAGGAKLFCRFSLPQSSFWVHLEHSHLRRYYFECQIAWSKSFLSASRMNLEAPAYSFGVTFQRVVGDAESMTPGRTIHTTDTTAVAPQRESVQSL